MATSARIIDALKRQLKLRGLTYKALAERLNLSESAVKHMFSTGNFSLRRLDELCAILEIDIGDLVTISESLDPKIEQLSAEHEREMVSDIRLLLVTYYLLNFWSFDEIIERYEISREDGLKYLRRLDRMKIIELQPGDRVRLLFASNFSWRKNGAIEKYFRSKVQTEFFSNDFSDDASVRIVKSGILSRKSQMQIIDKLKATGEHFDDLNWDERRMPASDRHGTTMVLAIRHWFFPAFRKLERR